MARDSVHNVAADVANWLLQAGASTEPDARLVASLKHALSEAGTRQAEILRRCALPRWFDADVLAILRERVDGNQQVFDILREYDFVHQLDERRVTYHDKVRQVLLQEWHEQRVDNLKLMHLRLATYFADRAAKAPTVAQEFCIHESIYHRLLETPSAGLVELELAFARAERDHDLAVAEALIEVAADALQDGHNPTFVDELTELIERREDMLLNINSATPETPTGVTTDTTIAQPFQQNDRPALRGDREQIEGILAQRGWKLLSADDVALRAAVLLQNGFARSASDAALYVYAEVLYHACSGTEGRERQQLAYGELLRFLYDASFRFAPELSRDEREEIVNQALAELYERLAAQPGAHRLNSIRSPGAFLAVSVQQLRNVVRRWRSIHFVAEWDAIENAGAGAGEDPADRALKHEIVTRVQQLFDEALQRYPRAKAQLQVVWMRNIDGLDYETIAAKLGMTAANARVLHARGLDRLRNDPDWSALSSDLTSLTGIHKLRA